MEVHQHTHTARKKWTHYFWEFFMMFAAISASFFVENQREHYVERIKERQYMTSMLADLKSDSILLSSYIVRNDNLMKGQDTLFALLKNFHNDIASTKEFYRLFYGYATWVLRARLADRTISQLKNSGGMRLIHVQVISDSILVYEEKKKLLVDQGEGYKRENDVLTDLSRKMLDYQYFWPLNIDAINSKLNFNPTQLFEFANSVKILKDQIETYIGYMDELLGRASNIITLIQKHYHLK